jgi:ArsR family transcriptional regulator
VSGFVDDAQRSRWLARLGTLGDLTRLRLLRLLERSELGVGELARATRLPQSTVSRHLKLLFEAELIDKRSEGTATLYRLPERGVDSDAAELWRLTRDRLGASPDFDEDDARLAEVLAERRTDSRAFFGRIGGAWDRLREELFGDRFTAPALLGLLDSDWTVADIGCGTGDASELLAPCVKAVVAIDRETSMLDAAKARLADWANVEFRQGDISRLPARNGEFDAAILMLVLHHLDDPVASLREIGRVLTPRGRLLVVDMVAHRHEEYRTTMGHVHLGFAEPTMLAHAKAAGFSSMRWRRLRAATDRKGPGLFAAALRKGN